MTTHEDNHLAEGETYIQIIRDGVNSIREAGGKHPTDLYLGHGARDGLASELNDLAFHGDGAFDALDTGAFCFEGMWVHASSYASDSVVLVGYEKHREGFEHWAHLLNRAGPRAVLPHGDLTPDGTLHVAADLARVRQPLLVALSVRAHPSGLAQVVIVLRGATPVSREVLFDDEAAMVRTLHQVARGDLACLAKLLEMRSSHGFVDPDATSPTGERS